MGHFCDLESREAKEIAPGVNVRTFWGSKMRVSVVDLAANSVVPLHKHLHEQVGTVVSGKLELTIAGERRWLEPGAAYVIPGGVEHGGGTGDTPARVVDVFSPVRSEYQY